MNRAHAFWKTHRKASGLLGSRMDSSASFCPYNLVIAMCYVHGYEQGSLDLLFSTLAFLAKGEPEPLYFVAGM